MKMKGKIALVTGGAGGIGGAIVEAFAAEGATVVVADIDARGGHARLQAVRLKGAEAAFVHVDVTNPTSVEAAVARTTEIFGSLDVLVNAAGGSARRDGDGPVDAATETGLATAFNLNFFSVFHACRFAIPAMRRSGGGAIVNIASVLGMVGVQDHFVTHGYAASKAAVIALTRSMAAYYAKDGIRSNVICPGLIRTPMSERALGDADIMEALKTYQPYGHVGMPEDVAGAAVYLAGADARFVSGVVLPVDGGWTAQ